jgi:FkbH-like protein
MTHSETITASAVASGRRETESTKTAKPVKCVVWDLDNTLWDGTLLEGDALRLRQEVLEVIIALDERGVLNSIASRNDHAATLAVLEQMNLKDYFLCPQICWDTKSSSIKRIAERINIALDTIVFVDDQPFEREEVAAVYPQVRCFDAADASNLFGLLSLHDLPATEEAKTRRAMYQADDQRQCDEEMFIGSNKMFLATLNMVVTIAEAGEADLDRAEELTVRTNQLNSTGRTYSKKHLEVLRTSPGHRVLVVTLDDKYGTYGRVGLALLELRNDGWNLKLLLMSCRVISRGIGGIVLYHLLHQARRAGVGFTAEFVATGRNRLMHIAFRFAGFQEVWREGESSLLKHELEAIPEVPSYVRIVAP